MLHALVARLLLWNLPGSTTPQVKSLNEALDREYAQHKEKKQGGFALKVTHRMVFDTLEMTHKYSYTCEK